MPRTNGARKAENDRTRPIVLKKSRRRISRSLSSRQQRGECAALDILLREIISGASPRQQIRDSESSAGDPDFFNRIDPQPPFGVQHPERLVSNPQADISNGYATATLRISESCPRRCFACSKTETSSRRASTGRPRPRRALAKPLLGVPTATGFSTNAK